MKLKALQINPRRHYNECDAAEFFYNIRMYVIMNDRNYIKQCGFLNRNLQTSTRQVTESPGTQYSILDRFVIKDMLITFGDDRNTEYRTC